MFEIRCPSPPVETDTSSIDLVYIMHYSFKRLVEKHKKFSLTENKTDLSGFTPELFGYCSTFCSSHQNNVSKFSLKVSNFKLKLLKTIVK